MPRQMLKSDLEEAKFTKLSIQMFSLNIDIKHIVDFYLVLIFLL